MSGFHAFEIVTIRPDLFAFRELPYTAAGWAAIAGGAFFVIFAMARWWFGLPRLTFAIMIAVGTVCVTLGVWLIGLEYRFSFFRGESAIDINMNWFGRPVSVERLKYSVPPVAEIVTTKRTTNQLVLRFADGRVKRLGLSTDRSGHAEMAGLINTFLQGGSILQ
jgi:hypothetical protein